MLNGLAGLSTPGLLTLVTLGQWAAEVFVQPSLAEQGTIPWASTDELLAGAAGEDGDEDEDEDAIPPLALTPWDLDALAVLTEQCAVLIEHLGGG